MCVVKHALKVKRFSRLPFLKAIACLAAPSKSRSSVELHRSACSSRQLVAARHNWREELPLGHAALCSRVRADRAAVVAGPVAKKDSQGDLEGEREIGRDRSRNGERRVRSTQVTGNILTGSHEVTAIQQLGRQHRHQESIGGGGSDEDASVSAAGKKLNAPET